MLLLLFSLLLGLSSREPDLSRHIVVFTIDDGYRSVYDYVYPLLRKHKMTATIGLITDYLAGPGGRYGNPATFLSYQQVREMLDSAGIEIASHTLSHPWLTRLDSADAWREIYRSKEVLESLFGVPVITFVYPYGDMDFRTVRMVRRAGYRLARAVRPGVVNFWVDPYRVPEFELRRGTTLEAVKNHIRNNPVAVLLLHRVVPNPRVFTEWPVDSFADLVAWMAENRIQTRTLAELYYEWRQGVVALMLNERHTAGLIPDSDSVLLKKVDVDKTGTFNPR